MHLARCRALSFTIGLLAASSSYAYGDEAALRQVSDFWLEHGASPQVASAWAAEVDRESGGDATRVGDGGTSIGAYQHHNGRAAALLLNIENNQAFRELMGDDAIAAAHRGEIMSAPDEAAARAAIKRYFFRPAGTPSPHPRSTARVATIHRVLTESSAAIPSDLKSTSSDPFSFGNESMASSFLITNTQETK